MRIRFIAAVALAAAIFSGCQSTKAAAPAPSPSPAAPSSPTVHLVGTATIAAFQFVDSRNKMKETSPGVYELTITALPASKETWVTSTGKMHAVKFVVDKDWKKGYIGDGWSGPLVLDTGMTNLYLDLVEGKSYHFKVDLNTMTYEVTEVK